MTEKYTHPYDDNGWSEYKQLVMNKLNKLDEIEACLNKINLRLTAQETGFAMREERLKETAGKRAVIVAALISAVVNLFAAFIQGGLQ